MESVFVDAPTRDKPELAEEAMTNQSPTNLTEKVYLALKAAFSELLAKNPDQSFYTFALFTDDSLQFLHPAANSEEALTATVERYNLTVDPKYGSTSTRDGMRWAYGDWDFFANFGDDHFDEVNAIVQANFDSSENIFESQIESLWAAVLEGFRKLDAEQFFGTGEERSQITLLLVGDLPEELVKNWVAALNPQDVVDGFLNWNADGEESNDDRKAALIARIAKLSTDDQVQFWIAELNTRADGQPSELDKVFLNTDYAGWGNGCALDALEQIGQMSVVPLLELVLKLSVQPQLIGDRPDKGLDETPMSSITLKAIWKVRDLHFATEQVESLLHDIIRTACNTNANRTLWGTIPFHAALCLHTLFDDYPKPAWDESTCRLLTPEQFQSRPE